MFSLLYKFIYNFINVAWEKRNKIDAHQRKQIARIHREVIENYFADSLKGGVGSPQKEVFLAFLS